MQVSEPQTSDEQKPAAAGAGGEKSVEVSTAEVPWPDPGADIGPLLICGRQHSGNTVSSLVFFRCPFCYAQVDENAMFEHRSIIDKIADPVARAEYVHGELLIEDESLVEPAKEHLRAWVKDNPDAKTPELYREGMRFLVEKRGARFWAQKATSCIFYGDEILSAMPEMRMIYMLRNPFDISCSKKRRGKGREFIWGHMYSWNKGMKIALELEKKFPDRFMILKYEDMVSTPNETFEGVFDFLGIPFHESYLDVYHVNRSETGYGTTGSVKGINKSRVYYYIDNLTRAQLAALDMMAIDEAIDRWYADLPHKSGDRAVPKPGLGTKMKAWLLLAKGPFHYAWDYMDRIRRKPRHLITRTIHRLKQ